MRGSKTKALRRKFKAETGEEPSSAVLRVMKDGASPGDAIQTVLTRHNAGHRSGGPGSRDALHRIFIPAARPAPSEAPSEAPSVPSGTFEPPEIIAP